MFDDWYVQLIFYYDFITALKISKYLICNMIINNNNNYYLLH